VSTVIRSTIHFLKKRIFDENHETTGTTKKPCKTPTTKPEKVNVPKPMPINAELSVGEKLTEAGKEIVNEVVVPAAEGLVKSFFRRLFERIRF
jgi:hypothetical protein